MSRFVQDKDIAHCRNITSAAILWPPPKETIFVLVETNDVDELRRLLQTEPNAAAKRFGGWIPLHYAANDGYVEVCRLLLQCYPEGAAVESKHGMTALHFAAVDGNVEVCQLLLQCYPEGAAKKNDAGMTPLHFAAEYKRLSIYQLLIAAYPEALTTKNMFAKLPQEYDPRIVGICAAVSLSCLD